MVTKKYPWLTAFGTSIVCHVLLIILIGALATLYPSVPKDKGPLQVDLVSIAGGGGGEEGDGVEDSEDELEPEDSYDEAEPVVPADYEADNEAVNDVHEIAHETQQERKEKVKRTRSKRRGGTGNGNRGSGSGVGTGGGIGSGVGTGIGDATGAGTGETSGPQLLSSTEPAYPESARTNNIEGTVVVGLTINVSGTVSSAWVESSSGNGALDQAAVNAVYNWRFVPAKQNGVPVEVRSQVPVSFRLR